MLDFADLVLDAKKQLLSDLDDGSENKVAYDILCQILAGDSEEAHALSRVVVLGLLGELVDGNKRPVPLDFNQFPDIQTQAENELEKTAEQTVNALAAKYAA